MQVAAPQAERLADAQSAEAQQHQQEAVPPGAGRLQQGLPLLLGRGVGPGRLLNAQAVAGPGPVTQPAPLGTKLSRQVAVVGDLVEGGQHPAVHRACRRRVLEELADHRQHMVDASGARWSAMARTRPSRRRGAQEQHEPAQVSGTVLQTAPRPPAPAQESGQLAGVHPRGRLRPIAAKAQVEQEAIGEGHLQVVGVNHRPVRAAVRQLHTERTAVELRATRRWQGTVGHVGDGMTPDRFPRELRRPSGDRSLQRQDC